MTIDGKGRLFGKIAVVDIMIVLIIVAAIAGAGYKFTKSEIAHPLFAKAGRIQIQFYIEVVQISAAKAVKAGDSARELIQGTGFGRVSYIETGNSVSWVKTDKGEYAAASKDGYCSAVITMEANGLIGKNGVAIDNSIYYIGQIATISIGDSGFYYGRIRDIKMIQ